MRDRGGVKRLFGGLETLFSRTLLTAGEQTPSVKDTELRPGTHLFSRQCFQPAQQSDQLATSPQGLGATLDQVRCTLKVFGAQSVLYRLIDEPVLLVPHTGPAVQTW